MPASTECKGRTCGRLQTESATFGMRGHGAQAWSQAQGNFARCWQTYDSIHGRRRIWNWQRNTCSCLNGGFLSLTLGALTRAVTVQTLHSALIASFFVISNKWSPTITTYVLNIAANKTFNLILEVSVACGWERMPRSKLLILGAFFWHVAAICLPCCHNYLHSTEKIQARYSR